jgi:hypothetical protein
MAIIASFFKFFRKKPNLKSSIKMFSAIILHASSLCQFLCKFLGEINIHLKKKNSLDKVLDYDPLKFFVQIAQNST